jgi:hypothetical protein
MTILTHTGARFKPAAQSSGRRDTAGAANAHLAVIRRFGMCALAVLLAGGAAAGVIALKTAIFFLRYHYHSLGAGSAIF